MSAAVRIALWSGPRNLSTAMMRAWGSRSDTTVVDEPLYAHYLKQTGAPHPGAAEVIAGQESDLKRVTAGLLGPVPENRAIYYQKQMTHHLLPGMDLGWIAGLSNAFLIREPASVVASFTKVAGEPRLEETGLPQQVELFLAEWHRTGRTPPVIDAADVLAAPETMLKKLCANVGVSFDPAMLQWKSGPHATDGIWARHWYASVWTTTGFGKPSDQPPPEVPASFQGLLAEARRLYGIMHAHRLRP